MTKSQIFEKIFFIFILICLTVYTPAYAQNLGLVDLLSSQLGITKDQASGGAGSIFQLAKQNLNGNLNPAGSVPSANNRLPLPRVMGKILSQNSSTRSCFKSV